MNLAKHLGLAKRSFLSYISQDPNHSRGKKCKNFFSLFLSFWGKNIKHLDDDDEDEEDGFVCIIGRNVPAIQYVILLSYLCRDPGVDGLKPY